MFQELEQKRKKEEARKAPKVEVKYNENNTGDKETIKQNPESNSKNKNDKIP